MNTTAFVLGILSILLSGAISIVRIKHLNKEGRVKHSTMAVIGMFLCVLAILRIFLGFFFESTSIESYVAHGIALIVGFVMFRTSVISKNPAT